VRRKAGASWQKTDFGRQGAAPSNIDVHRVAVQLHELAASSCFALAHQFGDQAFGLQKVEVAQLNWQEAACVGIQGGFPELLCAHFAQPFEAADAPAAFLDALLAQLVKNRVEFAFVERIEFTRRFVLLCFILFNILISNTTSFLS
jgi:hypothetical protein